MNEFNIKFMKEALKQAQKAYDKGETPIGAVIVHDNKIIARAHNERETKKNALCHAEITAINKACKRLGGWRLINCDMYVTLKPCPMCAGAVVQSRINNLYFGAFDLKNDCAVQSADAVDNILNSNVNVVGGVMRDECSKIIKDFFVDLRKKKKTNSNQEGNICG